MPLFLSFREFLFRSFLLLVDDGVLAPVPATFCRSVVAVLLRLLALSLQLHGWVPECCNVTVFLLLLVITDSVLYRCSVLSTENSQCDGQTGFLVSMLRCKLTILGLFTQRRVVERLLLLLFLNFFQTLPRSDHGR